MQRYPVWRLVVIAIALLFGLIYTLPNFYGEVPAVQISSQKNTIKVDEALEARALAALKQAGIENTGTIRDLTSVKVRFANTDTQIQAKDVLERALNPDPVDPTYITALNLLPNTPQWLMALHALPMYLGLDLRGGVHFLLQVDTASAMKSAVSRPWPRFAACCATVTSDKLASSATAIPWSRAFATMRRASAPVTS